MGQVVKNYGAFLLIKLVEKSVVKKRGPGGSPAKIKKKKKIKNDLRVQRGTRRKERTRVGIKQQVDSFAECVEEISQGTNILQQKHTRIGLKRGKKC